jgi:hypothetical protein
MTVSGFDDHGAPLSLNLFIPIGDALRTLSLEPLATPGGDRSNLNSAASQPRPKHPTGARK